MPKNRIFKTKDGRYQYKVTDSSGNRRQIFSRRGETRGAFSIRCDQLDKEETFDTEIINFNDLFYAWIRGHVEVGLSPGYRKICVYVYDHYVGPYYGQKRIQDIKRRDVYQLLVQYDKKGMSSSTLSKIRACFSRPYNWAINALALDLVSPTQGLIYRKKSQKRNSRSRVITDEEMSRFLKAAEKSKYYNYFLILKMTGLRPSECLGLKIKDIKSDHLEIRRGITRDGLSPLKTDTAIRDIPLTDSLKKVLSDQKAVSVFVTREGWLFPSESGKPSMNAIENATKRAIKQTAEYQTGGHNGMKKLKLVRSPIKLSLYDFRHTYATKMAEQNINPKALQYLMGHKDIETTLNYYIGITDKMLDQAKKAMENVV